MADDDALTLVRLRNNFYRDNYRRVLAALLLMVFINLLLAATVFYLLSHEPTPKYFATTADGKLIRLTPLSDPMVSQAALLAWANEAAVAVNNYDFVTWREKLQKASSFFTPDGWKAFEGALKSTGNLKTVINEHLTVNAVATGAPVILNQGVINGRYTWQVQIPLLVTFQSASQEINQSYVVTMLITRVSVLEFPKGIAIAQYVGTPKTTDQP